LGLLLHCPRHRAAPARLKGYPRAFIDPQRLEGAHEAMRVGFVLFRTATSIHLLANRNSNAASLRSTGPEMPDREKSGNAVIDGGYVR
jgi:hypothetical protein